MRRYFFLKLKWNGAKYRSPVEQRSTGERVIYIEPAKNTVVFHGSYWLHAKLIERGYIQFNN